MHRSSNQDLSTTMSHRTGTLQPVEACLRVPSDASETRTSEVRAIGLPCRVPPKRSSPLPDGTCRIVSNILQGNHALKRMLEVVDNRDAMAPPNPNACLLGAAAASCRCSPSWSIATTSPGAASPHAARKPRSLRFPPTPHPPHASFRKPAPLARYIVRQGGVDELVPRLTGVDESPPRSRRQTLHELARRMINFHFKTHIVTRCNMDVSKAWGARSRPTRNTTSPLQVLGWNMLQERMANSGLAEVETTGMQGMPSSRGDGEDQPPSSASTSTADMTAPPQFYLRCPRRSAEMVSTNKIYARTRSLQAFTGWEVVRQAREGCASDHDPMQMDISGTN